MKIEIKYYGKYNKNKEENVINLLGQIRYNGSADGDDDDGKGQYHGLLFKRVSKNELKDIKKLIPDDCSVIRLT